MRVGPGPESVQLADGFGSPGPGHTAYDRAGEGSDGQRVGGCWKPGLPAVPAARSTERPSRPAAAPNGLDPRPPSAGGTTTTGQCEARTSLLPSQRAPTSVEWPASMTTRSALRLSSTSTARRLPATTRVSTR